MNEEQADNVVTREKYPFTNSSKGERAANKIAVDQLAESNVLNSFRSVTYNFTLAGLKKELSKLGIDEGSLFKKIDEVIVNLYSRYS